MDYNHFLTLTDSQMDALTADQVTFWSLSYDFDMLDIDEATERKPTFRCYLANHNAAN